MYGRLRAPTLRCTKGSMHDRTGVDHLSDGRVCISGKRGPRMSILHPDDPIHRWITAHGCAWGPRVEREYFPEEQTPGACFSNALQLMNQYLDLRYCEGMGCYAGLPLLYHHAWCVTQAGEVVDPTWADGEGYMGVGFGRQYANRRYQRMLARGRVGSLIDPWDTDRNYRLTKGQVSRRTWER